MKLRRKNLLVEVLHYANHDVDFREFLSNNGIQINFTTVLNDKRVIYYFDLSNTEQSLEIELGMYLVFDNFLFLMTKYEVENQFLSADLFIDEIEELNNESNTLSNITQIASNKEVTPLLEVLLYLENFEKNQNRNFPIMMKAGIEMVSSKLKQFINQELLVKERTYLISAHKTCALEHLAEFSQMIGEKPTDEEYKLAHKQALDYFERKFTQNFDSGSL